MRFRLVILLALPLAAFAQGQSSKPIGDGINFCSLDKEIASGERLATDVRRESKLFESDLVQDFVARLGRQLAAQTPGARFPYSFTAIQDLPAGIPDDPTHEAMALPGGPIFIRASLILQAENTTELAGMLAHAIGHVAARHCTRSLTRVDLMQIESWTVLPPFGCWVVQGAMPMGYLQFQQAFERQADYFAVQIMAQAGYDPAALAAYVNRVQPPPKRRNDTSRSFSPWPPAEERIKLMQKEIAKLLPGQAYSAGDQIEPIQAAVRSLPAK
jgi:beta-barrel assembly-enhancing protease